LLRERHRQDRLAHQLAALNRLPLNPPQALLLIILDDCRRPNLCFVRVNPDVAKGTALAQEVPALIQLDLDLLDPLTIGFVKCPCLV
jgi:hypothetical protein